MLHSIKNNNKYNLPFKTFILIFLYFHYVTGLMWVVFSNGINSYEFTMKLRLFVIVLMSFILFMMSYFKLSICCLSVLTLLIDSYRLQVIICIEICVVHVTPACSAPIKNVRNLNRKIVAISISCCYIYMNEEALCPWC